MHVPDGFLDVPISLATGLAAAGALGLALRRSGTELHQAGAARAGLTGCFVFAAQMINFPVAAGTSGHLIGAALAVALVGPWTAVLALACVLLVQALVFADGGITALGTNLLLLAVVPVLVASPVMQAVMRLVGRRRAAVVPAAAVAALVSVPAAALVFSGLYVAGGRVEVPVGLLLGAMTGTHLLIGIGEALITAGVLAAVMAARPDLVHLWRGHSPRPLLQVVGGDGLTRTVPADALEAPAPPPSIRSRRDGRRPLLVGLGVISLVAGGLSLVASGFPDGLESVAASLGFAGTATESVVAGSPLADYGLVGAGPWGTSVAGLAGVALTLGTVLSVVGLSSRRRRPVPLTLADRD